MIGDGGEKRGYLGITWWLKGKFLFGTIRTFVTLEQVIKVIDGSEHFAAY